MTIGHEMTTGRKRLAVKSALVASAVFWGADTVYKLAKDITYVNREQCVLFRALPKPAFVLFEYFFETLVIVFVGTFIAVWLARQFLRFRRFFPTNPVTAFLYGALLPVCSCGVIPLVAAMKGRLKLPTVIAFIMAAPVLSPYIIALSFSVLGPTYGLLRILSAFVLTMACACVAGLVERKWPVTGLAVPAAGAEESGGALEAAYVLPQSGLLGPTSGNGWARRRMAALAGAACSGKCPGAPVGDIYLEAFSLFRKLLPYLVVAGLFGVGLEYLGPRNFLMRGGFGSGVGEIAIWALVGVPLYFCNGADVFFLRPLVSHGFPLGTAIAFSLTSTAVCITSLVMLFKLIGGRVTAALAISVPAVSISLALLLNWIL
ncbi:MAG: permease [bacterium]